MKSISAALAAHYAATVQTTAVLWRITLTNGLVHYFTDHDRDVVYEGSTYLASGGYDATDIQSTAALNVDNLELSGLLTLSVSRDDLLSGVWGHALIEIRRVNYLDLSMGHEWLKTGRLGETTVAENGFRAEIRGLMQALQRNIGELTSPVCRYDLGDSRCTKVLTDYTATGAVVSSVVDQRTIITNLASFTVRLTPSTTGAPPNDYFQGNKITWLTGDNAGVSREIESYTASSQRLVLAVGMYYTIQPGDTFTAIAGCNKLLKTGAGAYLGDCKIKFGNVVNFGGEPEVPGEKSFNVGGQI